MVRCVLQKNKAEAEERAGEILGGQEAALV